MARRRINWTLIIVLIIAVVVVCITVYGLRQWNRSHRAQSGLRLGNEAYASKQWDEAAANLGKYLAIVPDDMDVLMKYAQAQINRKPMKSGNVKQAANAYRKVLRIDRTRKEAAIELIEIYLRLLNSPSEAELIATQQLTAGKDDTIRTMLAVALVKQRKFVEAREELNTIINDDPAQISAYEALGRLAEERPEIFSETADYYVNQAVKNNPTSAPAYIMRGRFHLNRDDRKKALRDFVEAEKHDLSESATRLSLAKAFIDAGFLNRSRQHLKAIYEKEKGNFKFWHVWATLALRNKSDREMQEVAERGLKALAPDTLAFLPMATELLIRSGRFERASEYIDQLRQKEIPPSIIEFLEGIMAEQKGQPAKAVKHWRRAMQMGRQSEYIQLATASVLTRLGDRDSAIVQLRNLISQNEKSHRARLALAQLLAESGKPVQAAEQTQELLRFRPDWIEARLFDTQIRMQMLANSQADEKSPVWDDIEKELEELQKNRKTALPVKLMWVQAAIQRKRFDQAEKLITELKRDNPTEIKVFLAEVELIAAGSNNDRAIEKLHEITRLFPDSPEPVKYLVTLLTADNRPDQCPAIVKEAISRAEEPEKKRQLNLLLADVYVRSNQPEMAYELLEAMAKEETDDIPVKRRLLELGRRMNQTDAAQQIIEQIKSLEGKNGWQWRYEQAKIWFEMENFKEHYPQVILVLKENLVLNPDDLASRLLLAASYEKAGELQLAVSMYNEALSRAPDNIELIISTVTAMYQAEEYGRADEILNQALKENLSDPRLSQLEVNSFLRQGKLSPAIGIMEEFLQKDPENTNVKLSLAFIRMSQNEFGRAEESLNQLRAQDPNSLAAAAAMVELLIRQEKKDQALELCNEIVRRHGNATAYTLRGRTYVRLGKMSLAREDLTKAIETEPEKIETLTLKGRLHLITGELDEALRTIKKALTIAADHPHVQRQAALIFLQSPDRGDTQYARVLLNKALATYPDDTELLLQKSRLLLLDNTRPSIKLALDILKKMTIDHPKTRQAWAMLADVYFNKGDAEKSLDYALRGLAHLPDDKALMLAKARAEASQSAALAVSTLKTLADKYNDDADIAVYLARMYLRTGAHEEAVQLLQTRLSSAKDPDARKLDIALAAVLYENGSRAEAEKKLAALYQTDPADPKPLRAIAAVLKKQHLWDELVERVVTWYKKNQDDFETPTLIAQQIAADNEVAAKKAAEDILRKVVDVDPNCVDALNSLAVLVHATGRSAEAVTLYQKVLDLDPDRLTALNNLAWILCEEQNDSRMALQLVTGGLKKAPNYVDLIDTRGMAMYRMDRYDEAIEHFAKCLRLYPSDTPQLAVSHFHLAGALAKTGQTTEAAKNLKQALSLNARIGGLSETDLAEAKKLLKELLEESTDVSNIN